MRCWRLDGEVRQQCSNFGRGEHPENERLDAPPGNLVSVDTKILSEGART